MEQWKENVPLLEIGSSVIGGDCQRTEHVIPIVIVAALMMPIERNQVGIAPTFCGVLEIGREEDGVASRWILRMPIQRKDLEVRGIALAFRNAERPQHTLPKVAFRRIHFTGIEGDERESGKVSSLFRRIKIEKRLGRCRVSLGFPAIEKAYAKTRPFFRSLGRF